MGLENMIKILMWALLGVTIGWWMAKVERDWFGEKEVQEL